MLYLVAGLGNPGKGYERTRHNAGRIILDGIRKTHLLPEWKEHGAGALVSRGVISGNEVLFVLPERFMNISGTVLKKLLKEERDTAIALVYDDLDLPLGTLKLSFGRGAGGHRGVQSVIDELGTKDFLRVRVGILPKTIFGTIKKPKGERAVEEFLLKPFGRREDHAFESIAKEADRALMLYMEHGKEKALSLFPQEKEA